MTQLGARARWAVAGGVLFTACATLPRPAVLDQTLSASTSAEMSTVRQRAPQAFARAEQLRLRAEQAHRDELLLLSRALAENALVAFERASLQARSIQVRRQIALTTLAAEQRTRQIAELSALQEKAAEETKRLELRLEIEQHALPRARVEPGGGARRAAAQAASAKSIVEAAQLLCVAARLLAPEHTEVRAALTEAESLADKIGQFAPHEALNQAMDARVKCLQLLSDVRAEEPSAADAADVLLSKLSPSLADLRPHRDDRGIVLTAYDIWTPAGELTPQGRDILDRVMPVVRSNNLPLLVVVYGTEAGVSDSKLIEQSLGTKHVDVTVRFAENVPSLLVVSPAEAKKSRTELILVTR